MLIRSCSSALGRIILASDGEALTGLWFEGQRYCPAGIVPQTEKTCPALAETEQWLAAYFAGQRPDFRPEIRFHSTPFREMIWGLLLEIPYGESRTYGEIADEAEQRTGRGCSPRAVGGAVGHNPISLLIPCHRVIGADGKMTGYAGGMDRKQALLRLEQGSAPDLFAEGNRLFSGKTPDIL
ncbi:MAG: methylated-DNA--[Clostridia bacterium]|nr:methylated-DNA--[protein]-cysteine S-methyltransferase [Clostridia bacterium]